MKLLIIFLLLIFIIFIILNKILNINENYTGLNTDFFKLNLTKNNYIFDENKNITKCDINGQNCITKNFKYHFNTPESVRLVKNKVETSQLLLNNQLPAPKYNVVNINNNFNRIVQSNLSKNINYPIIIKPINGTFGIDVYTNIENNEEFNKIINELKNKKKYDYMMVEEYIQGHVYRVFIFNNKVIDVVQRERPFVIGNGNESLSNLINQRNQKLVQDKLFPTKNISSNLIKKQGYTMNSIISNNQIVYISDVINMHNGAILKRIDIQSIDWMNTWNELSTPVSKALGLKSMQGLFGIGDQFGGVNYFHIPIQFWFCRNAGLALPLIALQYHEVKVKFVLGGHARVNQGLSLYCDYIYLDTDERRRFAQGAHEYLIEQVQEQTIHKSGTQKLRFNHPVKELIWRTNNSTGAQLKLNGHDRFSKRPAEYFELQQPYDYHTHCPRQNLPMRARISEGEFIQQLPDPGIHLTRTARTSNDTHNIGVYSFALKPEEHQPSGTCNFSRIDSAELTLEGSSVSEGTIYAVNYNVLRIMSGMGGLAYSN